MIGLGIVSLVVGAVGAGLQFVSAQRAAATQERLGALNYQLQADSLRQQRQVAGMQSLINQQLASNEKATLERNAGVLEQQASVNTAAGRENARRTREDYARLLAAQRAQIAKAGVADTTGSPLSLLAATAEEEQRAVDEVHFQTETQRRNLFREADNQRSEGLRAEMDIYGAQAVAGAAKLQAQNALSQAHLDLLGVKANAAGMKRAAWGNLLASGGNLLQQGASMFQRTPRTASYSAIG
jgi:hypothetical protein